jgi:hypothetical protein
MSNSQGYRADQHLQMVTEYVRTFTTLQVLKCKPEIILKIEQPRQKLKDFNIIFCAKHVRRRMSSNILLLLGPYVEVYFFIS